MLKLLIVDDEKQVRDGLEKIFDWESMGFSLVGKAQDGEEALEKFMRYLPDVVITDICMTNMNGLSLLTKLKELNSNVEIIILTGYPQFDYAKRALSEGAFAYLLKPLKTSELSETMNKVMDKILHTKQRLNEIFLTNLLQLPSLNDEDVSSLCKKYSFYVLPNQIYFIATIQLDNCKSDSEYRLYEVFCNLLRTHMCVQYNIAWCHNQQKCVSVMAFCQNNNVKFAICDLLNKIKDEFTETTGESVTLGISNTVKSITKINEAYLQSLYAVSQKAIYGYGLIIHYREDMQSLTDDVLTTSLFISSYDIQNILNGIQTFNRKIIDNTIENYFLKIKELKNLNIDIIKSNLADLAIQIIHFSAPDASSAKILYGNIPHPIADINKLNLLSDMEHYIKNLVDTIFARPNLLNSQEYSKLVRDAEIYIMLHYSLPITVASIANELHVNHTHLMRTFKKETGKTINEHLTSCRIDAAINLFESGDYQVSEVATHVGYQDPKYFCKVFKRITGYSPSDYLKK